MTDIGMPRVGDTVVDYTPLSADEDWKGLERIRVGFTATIYRQGVERVCKHDDCIQVLRHDNATGLCADHYRKNRRRLERKL